MVDDFYFFKFEVEEVLVVVGEGFFGFDVWDFFCDGGGGVFDFFLGFVCSGGVGEEVVVCIGEIGGGGGVVEEGVVVVFGGGGGVGGVVVDLL